MSTNKTKTANNCRTNCGVTNRSSCESPSPTKPEPKKIPPIKASVGLAPGPDLKNVKSKIGSFDNVKHKPTGGEKKVESQKVNWHTNVKSRVGSLENAKHRPHGGEVKVVTQKLDWKAHSKVGSLENVKHTPGGGQVKIFDEKYAKSPSSTPTPTPSGAMTPTPTPDGKENDTLKTLSAVRISTEMMENNHLLGSPNAKNESLRSPPSTASSMRSDL